MMMKKKGKSEKEGSGELSWDLWFGVKAMQTEEENGQIARKFRAL